MAVDLRQTKSGSVQFIDERSTKPTFELGGPQGGTTSFPFFGGVKYAKISIGSSITNSGGGLMIWTNTEQTAVMVTRALISVVTTAAQAGAAALGQAISTTAVSANLISGFNLAATTLGDSLNSPATPGAAAAAQLVQPNQYVTMSVTGAGSAAGFNGNVYIGYILT